MGLDVRKLDILQLRKDTQLRDLVDQLGPELFGGHVHLRPTEILPVLEGGVRTNPDLVLPGQAQSVEHGLAIPGMTAAGNAARVEVRHDIRISPYPFSQIAIDVHRSFISL